MKNVFEKGRTLLEMLSVLAILGVLSLAGIAGYQYAMTYYKANETVNEVNQWGVAIASQMLAVDVESGNEAPNLGVKSPTRMGYRITAAKSTTKPDHFDISVYQMPVKVCERILAMSYTQPSAIYVVGWEGSVDNGKCGEGSSADMIFEFNKSLDSTP